MGELLEVEEYQNPIVYGTGGLNFVGPFRQSDLQSDLEHQRKSKVIFGETSGVYPQIRPGSKNVYDSDDWDSASARKLQEARRKIALVSERNPSTWRAEPNLQNPIERRAWELAQDAPRSAHATELPDDVKYFYLRQEGVKDERSKWLKSKTLHESLGPFINTGGGDAKKGSRLYIDFYGD